MRRGNLAYESEDKVTWKLSRDILTRRHDNVIPRGGGDVPQRRYWVFCLGVTGDVVGCTNGRLWIRVTLMSWWHTTETLSGVSFETCLRRCRDYWWYVVISSCWDTVTIFQWDVFETYHWDFLPMFYRFLVFQLTRTCDFAGTYKEMLLQSRHEIWLTGGCVRYLYFIIVSTYSNKTRLLRW